MLPLSSLRLFFLVLLSPALFPGGALGQECPHGRISYVFVDNRSIFDTGETDPGARLGWVYRLANTLHIRTREDFIRNEILFQAGECLDPLLLEESERILRSYRFIARSDIFAVPQPDGSQHVVVDTQDEWTTRVDMGFRLDDGLRFLGFEVTEENLMGRGMLLRLFYREDEEQRDVGVEFQTPRVGETRWDARLAFGNTRTGTFFEEALMYPFVGEVGRIGARQSFVWRETLFAYALPEDRDHTHLLVPFLDHRWDLAVGGRLGRPGNLTVFGLGISKESIRFDDFPSSVELVKGNAFGAGVPAEPWAVEEVRNQTRTRRANRINFFFGQRNLRFVQRRGLDALTGTQDVQVGTELFLGLGRALESIQEGGDLSPDDLHAQITLSHGGVWKEWTLNTRFYGEAREEYAGQGMGAEWRDVFAEADAYLYWQPRDHPHHTLLLRASGVGGWSVESPYQLTLGGRFGIRGYRQQRFPGGRRFLLTLEERMYLPWPAPDVFDFGLSVFLDLGMIRAGEVPFGAHSGWQGALGGGIRFGLPPGTARTARIDLALPLMKGVRASDLILRVTLQEMLGILPGILDEQLLRSLRNGVRPYLIDVPW